ncbi:hypothetical protein EV715DRAFT_278227 [Schizophyllum commune]
MGSLLPFDVQWGICRGGSLSKKDLCSIARASKSWHEVATPIIWESLQNLDPLIQFLDQGGSLDNLRPHKLVSNFYPTPYPALTRLLENSERIATNKGSWSTIYTHSSMIKRFNHELSHNSSAGTIHLCRFLIQYPPPYDLFPHLRFLSLRGHGTRHCDFSPLLVLLSPAVEVLHIPACLTRSTEGMIGLTGQSPNVNDLSLSMAQPPSLSQQVLLRESIAKLTHLNKITLDIYYDPAILLQISQKESLSSLTLEFNHFRCLPGGDAVLACPMASLPQLEKLTLGGLRVDESIALIRSWDMPRLQELTVGNLPCTPTLEEVKILVEYVCNCCGHNTLRVLALDQRPELSEFALIHEDLLPLACFAHLTHLTIGVAYGPLMSDADYATLSSWWPNLVVLDLNALFVHRTDDEASEMPATLATLHIFAHSCPHLQSLSLALSIDEIPAEDKGRVNASGSHPLRNLYLGSSPMHVDAIDIARYLKQLFPKLPMVGFYGDNAFDRAGFIDLESPWWSVRSAMLSIDRDGE